MDWSPYAPMELRERGPVTPPWMTRAGYVVLALAFIVRAVSTHLSPVTHRMYSDMGNYGIIADELMMGVWKPTHFFQPIGFSFVLYVFKSAFTDWPQAFGLYQSILAAVTLWFMWKSAEKSFGPAVGLGALVVGAVHLQWLAFNLFALSENTFAALLSILLWVSLKVVERESVAWSLAWGLVFIAAFMIKGTHVFLGPLFLLGILHARRWRWTAFAKVALPASAIVLTGLLLHGWLAYRTIGTFQMGASAGGLNFVEGKCRAKINEDVNGNAWYSPLYAQLDLDERRTWGRPFTDSGYFFREGLKCVEANPMVLVQSLENIPFLFIGNFSWPASMLTVKEYLRFYELFFSIALLVGLVIWLRSLFPIDARKLAEILVWGLPIFSLFLCVYIFKSEIRFRVPFDVFFIPVAVKGWSLLLAMNSIGRRHPEPASS